MVDPLTWLRGMGRLEDPFLKEPHAKVRHLAIEACSLDAARMRSISERKRFALVSALIKFRRAGVVDDLYEILTRKMGRIHANFTQDTIDWKLIEKHLADMHRIVLSIQEGRVSPSTILRRLGTHSRKNNWKR